MGRFMTTARSPIPPEEPAPSSLLSRNYFLVTSTGGAATRWLAATLNRHPEIVCSGGAGSLEEVMAYGSRPTGEQVERIAQTLLHPPQGSPTGTTLDTMFEELANHRGTARFVGNVHRESVASLHLQIRQRSPKHTFTVANVIRHPVPRTETKYNNELFNEASSPSARRLAAAQYQDRVGRFQDLVDRLTRRLARYELDLHKRLFIHSLMDTVEGMADFQVQSSPFSIPHFKMEQLKSDRDTFAALVGHLTADQLHPDEAYLDFVFSPENLNAERFRTDRLASIPPRDARAQWEAWEEWQRTAFVTAMEVHEFHKPFIAQGYSFDFVRTASWPGATLPRRTTPPPRNATQIDRIRNAVAPGRTTIAFFCASRAFRAQFGSLPAHLERQGHNVLYLYGEKHGGEFESHPTSFQVWDDICERLDFVDVFAVPNITQGLPNGSKKVLFQHNSFAEVPFPNQVSRDQALDPYAALVNHHAHFRAYLPLYDYILAASPMMMEFIRGELRFHGRVPVGAQGGTPVRSAAADGLLKGLHAQRVASRQCLIPAGYPPLDAGIRAAATAGPCEKVITYAPTLLKGKQGWAPYVSIQNSGRELLLQLLRRFPDYQIVFKPCHSEDAAVVEEILRACSPYLNFVHDTSSSNHQKLYARTSVLISDFSSTAYTFAFSNLRPVVFLSPRETDLPPVVRDGPFCTHRSTVGSVARSVEEAVDQVGTTLTRLKEAEGAIRELRKKLIYNIEASDRYLEQNFDHVLRDTPLPDWECYEWGSEDPLRRPDFSPGLLALPYPVVLESDLLGFDILSFRQRFHALAVTAGPVDLRSVSTTRLEGLTRQGRYFVSDSLQDIEGFVSRSQA